MHGKPLRNAALAQAAPRPSPSTSQRFSKLDTAGRLRPENDGVLGPKSPQELLGVPARGNETARRGYGPPVLRHYGTACVYCGLDFARSYVDWLHFSVEHVVPREAVQHGYPREWVEDLVNLRPCCGPCNGFAQRVLPLPPAPDSPARFLAIRDQFLAAKRERAQSRHRSEREEFERWRLDVTLAAAQGHCADAGHSERPRPLSASRESLVEPLAVPGPRAAGLRRDEPGQLVQRPLDADGLDPRG